jgi:dolichol-phosphate mannosyltransferase
VAAIAADLQDPPELIHEMLAAWRGGAKVVLAARAGRDDGFLTNLLSDAFYALFRRYAIRTMPRHGFDFFLLDRQVADLINGIQENNAYLMGLILWLGFQPKVLTYQRQARPARYGRSMWTFAKKIKYFIDSFVSFSYVPVRASSLLGIGLSVVGSVYAAILIFMRLAYEIQVEGWTTLMVVLLIVSGAQMMMLGVLGEYLWRNLDETRRRPRYVIERTVSAAPPAAAPEGAPSPRE